MWANSTAVGCGATRYFETNVNGLGQGRFYMTCDYAAGNVDGFPVYLTSKKGGSGCTSGTDSTYRALCSEKEKLNPNYYGW